MLWRSCEASERMLWWAAIRGTRRMQRHESWWTEHRERCTCIRLWRRAGGGTLGLVDEVYDQLHAQGAGELDAIVCSVGGGGLLRGIMQGAARYAGAKPALVAVQNFGVNSFNRSLDDHRARGEATLPEDVVTLAAIESKCTSMGTKRCSLETVHDAIRYDGDVTTLTVTDDLSASACWQFSATSAELEAEGRTRLVELSCASALTPRLPHVDPRRPHRAHP
ncbi:hypothetical protein L1887_55587 [Cichorium endivia]|nr:hypothetical protein L1887_55587 [Cichorium endivia]